MKIEFVQIKNFRKLQSCKIEFSDKETIFVGANNSGKTTAMDALITFLKEKRFKTQDFTLSNWTEINKIGNKWCEGKKLSEADKSVGVLEQYLPTLDLWISVKDNELHYVSHIIPSLDWKGGLLGIRLRFEPKNMEDLIQDFANSFNKSNQLTKGENKHLKLWPKHLWDFCESKIDSYFTLKTYLLDPEKFKEDQLLSEHSIALEGDVLKGLIKIDIVNAQRGFSDVSSDNFDAGSSKKLSTQLRSYYDKHLNPSLEPTESDLGALNSIQLAQDAFDKNLKESFQTSLEELENLNYPGFGNPQIQITTKVSTSDGLLHDSAVKYHLGNELSLPEKYNGLGYQNLISIIFKLIRFRDDWMKVGKTEFNEDEIIEPLHLVLIEEPEAHLHAQVQQVFIKNVYKILRKNVRLEENEDFITQLVISTHSSYIAHQKFDCLRYFKRKKNLSIPTSEIINLSSVFGDGKDETMKFVIRYLNTTHNDVFFADAVILVEGPAERMLIPHFIKEHHSDLDNCYITILEIGGSHAHRLKPLIEKLEVICLIITDIDSQDPSKNKEKKCQPKLGSNLVTSNDTLKKWHPKKELIDDLLKLKSEDKTMTSFPIRISYQYEVDILEGKNKKKVYPYTFEDALVVENKEVFEKISESTGLLKKMVMASKIKESESFSEAIFEAIINKQAKKAEFALDILYFQDPKDIKVPKYIKEGLEWLEEQLKGDKIGLVHKGR